MLVVIWVALFSSPLKQIYELRKLLALFGFIAACNRLSDAARSMILQDLGLYLGES